MDTKASPDLGTIYAPVHRDLELLGRFHANKWSNEGWQKAKEHLQRAIELDPQFATPHATLAMSYVTRAYTGVLAPKVAYAMSEESARTALALDPHESVFVAHAVATLVAVLAAVSERVVGFFQHR